MEKFVQYWNSYFNTLSMQFRKFLTFSSLAFEQKSFETYFKNDKIC